MLIRGYRRMIRLRAGLQEVTDRMKGSILIAMLMSCALLCACETTAPPPSAFLRSDLRDSHDRLRLKGGACALVVDGKSHGESLNVYIGDRNSALLRIDVGPLAKSLYPQGFSDAPFIGTGGSYPFTVGTGGSYPFAGIVVINGNEHLYGLGKVWVTSFEDGWGLEGNFGLNDQAAYGHFRCPFLHRAWGEEKRSG